MIYYETRLIGNCKFYALITLSKNCKGGVYEWSLTLKICHLNTENKQGQTVLKIATDRDTDKDKQERRNIDKRVNRHTGWKTSQKNTNMF